MAISLALVIVPYTFKAVEREEPRYINASVTRASETSDLGIGIVEGRCPFFNKFLPFIGTKVLNTDRLRDRYAGLDMSGTKERWRAALALSRAYQNRKIM